MDLDALEGSADEFLQREGDLLDEVAGDDVDVHPVLEDDVKAHERSLFVGGDDDAAAKAGRGKKLRQSIDGVRGRHSDDAVAFEGGMTCNVGDDVVGDREVACDFFTHYLSFQRRRSRPARRA